MELVLCSNHTFQPSALTRVNSTDSIDPTEQLRISLGGDPNRLSPMSAGGGSPNSDRGSIISSNDGEFLDAIVSSGGRNDQV